MILDKIICKKDRSKRSEIED